MDHLLLAINTEVEQVLLQPNAFRSVLILLISVVVAYWLSHFVAKGIIKVARFISSMADTASDEVRALRLRQTETYLSVMTAIVRAMIVGIVGFAAWRFLSPDASGSAAAIGAGTFFVVLGGATVGMVLRDITAGATMIIEKWFNVGDFIKVEPFWDVSGVVERVTLRSTRIRSLSGEIIWLHNQQIHGVHVTPQGVRTEAVDVYVTDIKKGEQLINDVIKTIPTGTLMFAQRPRIASTEKWGEQLWRIIVIGQTTPGREWLIEKYFVDSLVDNDQAKDGPHVIVREPIVRHADPVAERKFRRAVRVAQQEHREHERKSSKTDDE